MLKIALLVLFGSVAVTIGTVFLVRWLARWLDRVDELVADALPEETEAYRAISPPTGPGLVTRLKGELPDLLDSAVFGMRVMSTTLPTEDQAEAIRTLRGQFHTGKCESEKVAPLLLALADCDDCWCAVPHRMLYAAWQASVGQPVEDDVTRAMTMTATEAGSKAVVHSMTVTPEGVTETHVPDGYFNRAVLHLIDNDFVTVLRPEEADEDYLVPIERLFATASDPSARF